jgi:hypothetical protein
MANTNLPPGQVPGYGPVAGSRETGSYSGTGASSDPTNEPNQYPSSFFGVGLPAGTGAPGSPGAQAGTGDPTNEPGQTTAGFSGQGPNVIAETGAPGSMGAQNGGTGPDAVKYTRPGSYLSGTFVQDTVNDTVSGTNDWTQAIDGAYGGGKDLPGIKGNTPAGTGAGSGRVLRGGRNVRG